MPQPLRVQWPGAHNAFAVVLAGLLALVVSGARACRVEQPPQERAESCNRALARTINFGSMLDTAREGMGPILRDEYFTLSKKAGFTAVRLTVRWDTRADYKPPYAIAPSFFMRVDGAVKQAQANGLALIIDMHHYTAMNTNPNAETPRFLALWQQVAEHYRDAPATVMFELRSDLNQLLTQDVWSRVLPDLLKIVRASNPNRTLIVGGAQGSPRTSLKTMQLPADDRNLIASFNYYDPMKFTHQGAEWVAHSNAWLGTKWETTTAELQPLKDDFADIARWAKLERRPVLLSEFGAYSKADETSRAAWMKAVRAQAEALGFSWAYWELASGFGVLDPRTLAWHKPLLCALLPQAPVAGCNPSRALAQQPSPVASHKVATVVPPAPACSFAQPPQERAERCSRALARTINFGNMLDVAREGMGAPMNDRYFALSKQAGFSAIRLTIRWDARAINKAPYTITPAFFEHVDAAVRQAQANGLALIIDMHHYTAMNTNPNAETPRFLALWQQVAEHYRDAPPTVMFELLNEPHGALTQEVWNRVLPDVLKVIRASNPNRTLIVGGSEWNTRASLETLQLPADDRNLIATFHYYDPMKFTHQGAEWVTGSNESLGTKWQATPAELQTLKDDLADVVRWSNLERRPILLGEFGAYFKADENSRIAWMKAVHEQAEALGFSWAYWELASGFGVLEPETLSWRTSLMRALMPQSPVLAGH